MFSQKVFQNSGFSAGVFCCCSLFLFGCTPEKNMEEVCTSSVITISAYEQSSEERHFPEKKMEVRGIYIEKNTVLTVYHLLPPHALLSGYTIFQEFPEEDLLLLHTEECGTPISFSSLPIVRGMSVYPCEQKNNSVKITEFPVSSSAKNTTTEEITLFSELGEISGKYPWAISGMPLCTSEEKLIGIVVATRENSVLFRPLPESLQKRFDISL